MRPQLSTRTSRLGSFPANFFHICGQLIAEGIDPLQGQTKLEPRSVRKGERDDRDRGLASKGGLNPFPPTQCRSLLPRYITSSDLQTLLYLALGIDVLPFDSSTSSPQCRPRRWCSR
jgi:hypothetical protein